MLSIVAYASASQPLKLRVKILPKNVKGSGTTKESAWFEWDTSY